MLQGLFNPTVILVTWPVFLFSLSMHEFFHAWAADRLGDPTARHAGRLTLNPLAHYDPIGTTMGMVFRTFGWARPVPVNPFAFRSPRRDMMLASVAGPASNLILALCSVLLLKLAYSTALGERLAAADATARTIDLVRKVAAYGLFINLALAVFNLLPLHPLDGHNVLRGLLSARGAATLDRHRSHTTIVLMAILLLGIALPGLSPLYFLVARPVIYITRLALSGAEFAGFVSALRMLLA